MDFDFDIYACISILQPLNYLFKLLLLRMYLTHEAMINVVPLLSKAIKNG